MVASASLVAGLAVNIQNRSYLLLSFAGNQHLREMTWPYFLIKAAVHEMHVDLGATSGQFSLSISLFILFQGAMPMMWTAISEIKGRKVSCAGVMHEKREPIIFS